MSIPDVIEITYVVIGIGMLTKYLNTVLLLKISMSGNIPSSGISNRLQAVILTISIFLVALPTIASPDSFSPLAKWAIMLAGLAGVALKEGLGPKT